MAGQSAATLTEHEEPGLPSIVHALDWLSAAICVALLGFAVWAWPQLPSVIPIHFGPSGQPDGWGGRAIVLLLPGLAIAMFWFLTAVARHRDLHGSVITSSPERGERDRQFLLAVRVLGWLKLIIVIVFTYLFVATVAIAHGRATRLSSWFLPVTLAALLGVLPLHLLAGMRKR